MLDSGCLFPFLGKMPIFVADILEKRFLLNAAEAFCNLFSTYNSGHKLSLVNAEGR